MRGVNLALVAERVERVDDALHAGPVEDGDCARRARPGARKKVARDSCDASFVVTICCTLHNCYRTRSAGGGFLA